VQGNSLEDIPFRAAFGVWGSWVGLVLNILCLIAQFYVALFPIGGSPNASSFFQAYLAFPIVIAFYVGWKILKNTRIVRAHEVDLISGRREMNLKELRLKEIEERKSWGPLKKYFSIYGLANSTESTSGCARCHLVCTSFSGLGTTFS
jgi:yeast amino acid transporter